MSEVSFLSFLFYKRCTKGIIKLCFGIVNRPKRTSYCSVGLYLHIFVVYLKFHCMTSRHRYWGFDGEAVKPLVLHL